jgi:LmbE family N-acetylglucosaminyl deacetylase
MTDELRLLAVMAHPDDESLGIGGALARYAAEGVGTYVITATRGERGRIGTERPGPEVVGPVREAELRRAASILGVREVSLLGIHDGDIDRVDPAEAVAAIAAHVRRIRPQVVVTFGADGAYGHPDHIAISQLTGAALVAAADPAFAAGDGRHPAHRVSKLYWMASTDASWAVYREAFGELTARVDGQERRATSWPDWAVTTVLDTRAWWQTVWQAVRCHQSQVSGYGRLADFPLERHVELWGTVCFYRVWSEVNVGREREDDLFAGLRPPGPTRGA